MLFALLASPLARKLLGAALALAALATIVFAIYHAGTHAGAAGEASRQVAAGKSSFERIEAEARARLDAAAAREQQLAALVDKLTSDSAASAGRAAAAQSAASSDSARIAALSDLALRNDLAQRLGLAPSAGKPAGEGNSQAASALDSLAALRAIDARLSDCEHLSVQTAALTEQVTALTARDVARESQLTTIASERDAALDAYNQLVPLYAQAFRAAMRPRHRWFCLFLCTTAPRLNLPPPLSPPATLPSSSPTGPRTGSSRSAASGTGASSNTDPHPPPPHHTFP